MTFRVCSMTVAAVYPVLAIFLNIPAAVTAQNPAKISLRSPLPLILFFAKEHKRPSVERPGRGTWLVMMKCGHLSSGRRED